MDSTGSVRVVRDEVWRVGGSRARAKMSRVLLFFVSVALSQTRRAPRSQCGQQGRSRSRMGMGMAKSNEVGGERGCGGCAAALFGAPRRRRGRGRRRLGAAASRLQNGARGASRRPLSHADDARPPHFSCTDTPTPPVHPYVSHPRSNPFSFSNARAPQLRVSSIPHTRSSSISRARAPSTRSSSSNGNPLREALTAPLRDPRPSLRQTHDARRPHAAAGAADAAADNRRFRAATPAAGRRHHHHSLPPARPNPTPPP